jgi:hypothetical protein
MPGVRATVRRGGGSSARCLRAWGAPGAGSCRPAGPPRTRPPPGHRRHAPAPFASLGPGGPSSSLAAIVPPCKITAQGRCGLRPPRRYRDGARATLDRRSSPEECSAYRDDGGSDEEPSWPVRVAEPVLLGVGVHLDRPAASPSGGD